jgi:hypothetical protein
VYITLPRSKRVALYPSARIDKRIINLVASKMISLLVIPFASLLLANTSAGPTPDPLGGSTSGPERKRLTGEDLRAVRGNKALHQQMDRLV